MKNGGRVMAHGTHYYHVFATEGGYCAIAWNDVGVTRFQLPTKGADSTERLMLRRLPDAERGDPTAEVAKAIASVKRYFAGEETDFSTITLDLDGQDDFF